MPWNNNDGGNSGGGPWKPQTPSPWGQGPGGPIKGDDLARKLKGMMGGMGGNGAWPLRNILALIALGVVVWLLTGFYTVQTNQVGLNMIFGRYTGKTQAGLNYNLPYPIGSVVKPAVTDSNSIDIGVTPEESLMLTGDENIADVKFRVNWQIDPAHPEDYAFNLRHPDETVRAVAESAMRELVGRTDFQKIITADRKNIEPATQDLMQRVLNSYHSGVLILQVQLLPVDPPPQVIAAFKDVTASQQDEQRLANEAQSYANKVVPEARGRAARILQEAEAYRQQTVAEAKGQVSRFLQIYEQYIKAPDVTRERIYLETMERVLGGADKVILDKNASGVVPYLPLNDLKASGAGK